MQLRELTLAQARPALLCVVPVFSYVEIMSDYTIDVFKRGGEQGDL